MTKDEILLGIADEVRKIEEEESQLDPYDFEGENECGGKIKGLWIAYDFIDRSWDD